MATSEAQVLLQSPGKLKGKSIKERQGRQEHVSPVTTEDYNPNPAPCVQRAVRRRASPNPPPPASRGRGWADPPLRGRPRRAALPIKAS